MATVKDIRDASRADKQKYATDALGRRNYAKDGKLYTESYKGSGSFYEYKGKPGAAKQWITQFGLDKQSSSSTSTPKPKAKPTPPAKKSAPRDYGDRMVGGMKDSAPTKKSAPAKKSAPVGSGRGDAGYKKVIEGSKRVYNNPDLRKEFIGRQFRVESIYSPSGKYELKDGLGKHDYKVREPKRSSKITGDNIPAVQPPPKPKKKSAPVGSGRGDAAYKQISREAKMAWPNKPDERAGYTSQETGGGFGKFYSQSGEYKSKFNSLGKFDYKERKPTKSPTPAERKAKNIKNFFKGDREVLNKILPLMSVFGIRGYNKARRGD